MENTSHLEPIESKIRRYGGRISRPERVVKIPVDPTRLARSVKSESSTTRGRTTSGGSGSESARGQTFTGGCISGSKYPSKYIFKVSFPGDCCLSGFLDRSRGILSRWVIQRLVFFNTRDKRRSTRIKDALLCGDYDNNIQLPGVMRISIGQPGGIWPGV